MKFLLQTNYAELAKAPQEVAGIVVIFDFADGGMITATATPLQQWKMGTLSDVALWLACFFDPPETFDAAGSSGNKWRAPHDCECVSLMPASWVAFSLDFRHRSRWNLERRCKRSRAATSTFPGCGF
ncbi:MAG TPA: hypothetical protein VHW45_16915 [Candidatus Sulfotelmatobacter sp.]|nr:hypothetical protein [Candidatus Sulfotelmatobacter sp.]